MFKDFMDEKKIEKIMVKDGRYSRRINKLIVFMSLIEFSSLYPSIMAKYSKKNVQTVIDIFKKGRHFQKYLPKQLSLKPNTIVIPYEPYDPESLKMKITKYLSKSYMLKSLSKYKSPEYDLNLKYTCGCYHCSNNSSSYTIIDSEDMGLNVNLLKKYGGIDTISGKSIYQKMVYSGLKYMEPKPLKKKKKEISQQSSSKPAKLGSAQPKTFMVFKAKGNINCLVSDKEYEDDE